MMTPTDEQKKAWRFCRTFHLIEPGILADGFRNLLAALLENEFERDPRHKYTADDWQRLAEEMLREP